ncbi:DUF1365 domain-containing protein [Ottowia thiooxydans]|uniref:DUF1365 domain-containing protein n=1 Tax=Ottowia thiooxydans TaxID=219182 RepID=UPI00048BF529|nr:DUF1365 domain-containing protein [Ottowia thiooxydans]
MNARPLLGFGHVWHRRLRPVEHSFRYPGYFLMLPMRSLRLQADAVLKRNRRGWISFHDTDHGEGGADALAWFEHLLETEGISDADGEVWLHTFPRVLGYVFKPVSFWYAHRADGTLAAVLVEVNNTFGERHAYLLAGPSLDWGLEQSAVKQFHVSPFCEVRGEYRFRFEYGDGRILARVDLHDDQGPLLQTSVGGVLEALNSTSVRRAFFGTPLMTLGVIARIHWQALRLWAKRVPFHGKPSKPKRFVTR